MQADKMLCQLPEYFLKEPSERSGLKGESAHPLSFDSVFEHLFRV
jgi:hypothetical protein